MTYYTSVQIANKQKAIHDAAGWYGDTCADPELFTDQDRARALLYLRKLTRDLRLMMQESPLTPLCKGKHYVLDN